MPRGKVAEILVIVHNIHGSWKSVATSRPLVLGQGVRNASDLLRISPEALSVMATASASERIGSVCKVLGRVVRSAARATFTRGSCAEPSLKGTEVVSPGEAPIRRGLLRTTHKQN